MAYTFQAPGPGTATDVDFDFFDDAGGKDSPSNLGSSANWKTEKNQNVRSSSKANNTSSESKQSPPSKDNQRSDDDDYSSDYTTDSDSSYSDSETDAPSSNTRVTIEAKIPRVETDVDSDSKPPTRNDSSSQSPDTKPLRASQRRRSRSDERQRRSRSRSRSASSDTLSDDSDTTTDTDSDVTDVSPLHSPHDGRKSSNRKEVSFRPPSRSDREKGRYPLFKADRDDIDLKLLMQAVMEMDQKRNPKVVSPIRSRSNEHTFTIPQRNPTSANRRNFSFNNDNVRTIDKENQRLMQQIMNATATTGPPNIKKKKVPTATLR